MGGGGEGYREQRIPSEERGFVENSALLLRAAAVQSRVAPQETAALDGLHPTLLHDGLGPTIRVKREDFIILYIVYNIISLL